MSKINVSKLCITFLALILSANGRSEEYPFGDPADKSYDVLQLADFETLSLKDLDENKMNNVADFEHLDFKGPEEENLDNIIDRRFKKAQNDNIILFLNDKASNSVNLPSGSFLINLYGLWKGDKVNLSIVIEKKEQIKFFSTNLFLIKFGFKTSEKDLKSYISIYDIQDHTVKNIFIDTVVANSKPEVLAYITRDDEVMQDDYILIWKR